ncbi:hypothetical protein BGX31_010804 [Mortierella sp. GBA43]|nr:hypothetical protein BGX31_010804 [Mortierella sp. GBA43]
MCVSNAIVFYAVPFSFTSPFATGVAFGLMVSLIHGLNLKGVILAMTMYMLKPYIERQTLITALNPPSVPSITFLAPLASFCSAFGVLWLLYDLFGYLHASTDDLRDFFGITLPAPSIVTLKDVKDRSISLSWHCASHATISKHLIEIDGIIIGESGKQETSVVIQAENVQKESELIKKLLKETEDMQLANNQNNNKERILENMDANSQEIKEDNLETYPMDETSPANTSVTSSASSIHSGSLVDSKTSTLPTEEQIASLRVELESKEASLASLTLQLADLEKHYKHQEDQLKSEITSLREQQKQEDEPRQQAKAKLKELQDTLREAEAQRTKMEKEHRIELDKRQRVTEQLEVKQRKLESLRQTLRQSEEKQRSEKASHQSQIKELEETLRKRSEDVRIAESSLVALQESQKALCNTIENKEIELQKLQATIHSPKGHVIWEQKVKDLDHKCAQLVKQLEQHTTENQRLQEQLAEATKNIAKVRSTRESRKVHVEPWKTTRFTTSESTITDPQNQPLNQHQYQYQTQRGQAPARTKSGSIAPVGSHRTSLNEVDVKAFQNGVSGNSFNHHLLFGQPASADRSSEALYDAGSMIDPPLNEQSVIKSMFESPETIDLRHLRTVGSHSSLGAQSKILPSHLRSTSNPGTLSPRLSPTVSTLLPLQTSPSWELKPIARPGTLGRTHSQAESSSSSLNISNPSSPTSPHAMSLNQNGSGFSRKTLLKESGDRAYWGGYQPPDIRNRGHDHVYGGVNMLQPDYNLGTLTEESRMGTRWYPESLAHETLPQVMTDPWGQGEGRFKPNRVSVVSQNNREPLSSINMEGLLPSPTGSSTSSLDMGTQLPVDPLMFADHYFSHRNHRGFDTPSALSTTTLSSTVTNKQLALDANAGSTKTSKTPQVTTHPATTLGVTRGESDILGYGLRLNPFGWSTPASTDDNQNSPPRWNA